MRGLHVDPTDATPLWSQIEEELRRLVACRALPSGSPVPSVRDLARDLSINPATVARAYQRLAEAGVLVVRRGEGTYVADSPPIMGKEKRQRALAAGAVRYASLGSTLGATRQDTVEELKTAWESLSGAAKGEKK